ncbi:hypothetical protein [Brevibacillus reuszeri]|uniref:hypothetical protein n=1 Tax=Brevibacillus reuszeri TaxID=54915 RepID=UPI000CCC273B|nr:hypothetical protein [Brevibacillus reuszeri]
MIALVLSSRPLQAKEYLPETASLHRRAPEKVEAMNVTTYEMLLERLQGYEPKIILVVTADMSESAYRWIPEVMNQTKADQTLYILPKSQNDQYHLQVVIEELAIESNWKGNISLLETNLTFQEVADQLTGFVNPKLSESNETEYEHDQEQSELSILLASNEMDDGRSGHVITITGPGSSGATTFTLYHFPFLAKLNPDKEFLIVDINDDKADLVETTGSHHQRLSYSKTAFQRKKLEDIDLKYHIPYKNLPNLKVISAVQDQHKWSPNEIVMFLEKVRKEFDVIIFDMGELTFTSNTKIRLMRESNEVITVVRPDSFSLNRTLQYMKVLERLPTKVIITHFDTSYVSKSEVEKYLGLPVLGVVPYERGLIPKQTTNDLLEPTKKMQKEFATYKWDLELIVATKKRGLFASVS